MKIRLFKDEPPLCFNLEKWGINNIPILLVTGLSGSGKTTFAKKYALQHKAVCISFDVLKFYPQSSIESQQILNLFLKQIFNNLLIFNGQKPISKIVMIFFLIIIAMCFLISLWSIVKKIILKSFLKEYKCMYVCILQKVLVYRLLLLGIVVYILFVIN